MRENKICMNTKAATDLPGQDQQSDEEDEEIHRAHRLQILQHSGSVHREERSASVDLPHRCSQRTATSRRNAKIMMLGMFFKTVQSDASCQETNIGVDSVELLSHTGTEIRDRKHFFPQVLQNFSHNGIFFFFFTLAVSQRR